MKRKENFRTVKIINGPSSAGLERAFERKESVIFKTHGTLAKMETVLESLQETDNPNVFKFKTKKGVAGIYNACTHNGKLFFGENIGLIKI